MAQATASPGRDNRLFRCGLVVAQKATALKLAGKYHAEVEEVEKELKKAYKELNKNVAQSHLAPEDMYTVDSMKQYNQIKAALA